MRISCDGTTFKVHKAIVCPQSPVLAAEMQGSWEEAEQKLVHIAEFSSPIVYRMLSWLYTETYDSTVLGSDEEIPENWALPNKDFYLNAKAAAIADYYQVEGLKKDAAEQLESLAVAKKWSAEGFLEMARSVWNIMPPGDMTVRSSFENLIKANHGKICNDAEFVSALGQEDKFITNFITDLAAKFTFYFQAHETILRKQKSTKETFAEKYADAQRAMMEQQAEITMLEIDGSYLRKQLPAYEANETSDTFGISVSLRSKLLHSSDEGKCLQKLLTLWKEDLCPRCHGHVPGSVISYKGRWIVTCEECSRECWVNGRNDKSLKYYGRP